MSTMIVVTGAAGFIGSVLIGNLRGANIVAVDNFNDHKNKVDLNNERVLRIDRNVFIDWLDINHSNVEFIFHLGARTDTAETDKTLFDVLNTNYSKAVWKRCTAYKLPLVYASSAATYGCGELGFDDDEDKLKDLKPLNAYGWSKHIVDVWALAQKESPPFWAGLKFFNVFGPNEYHKGRMASVIWHAYGQLCRTGRIELFRSCRSNFEDGQQQRDFVYVEDVIQTCLSMYEKRQNSGIYNVGTGKARTFLDVARTLFKVCQKPEKIDFIDLPISLKDTYQYFTEANTQKLKEAGYKKDAYSLEDGIYEYVNRYLKHNKRYSL